MDDSQTDTLKNIELTNDGKKSASDLDYVRDPLRAEILSEIARDTILRILRIGIPDIITSEEVDEKTGHSLTIQRHLNRHALSIVELARLSNDPKYAEKPITKSQVIHHLPVLIEHGYVIKYGTVTVGKRTTDYYRRKSNLFLFANLPGYGEKEMISSYEHVIRRMGAVFNLTFKKSEEKELLQLFVKTSALEKEGREFVVGRAQSDIAMKDDVDLHRQLYRIYSFKSEEWIETNKRIREIIFPDEK